MSFVVKLLGTQPVRFRIDRGKVISIGRSKEADVFLDSKLVSRLHCELEASTRGLLVRDLQSRNGTLLNGKRFQGEVVAHPGDQIEIGSASILVEREYENEEEEEAAGRARGRSGGAVDGADPFDAFGEGDAEPSEVPALPGYEILSEVGLGSSGRVYRARMVVTDRVVALKVLEPDACEADRKRFLRAAKSLQRLDHPGVVKVYEVGDADGTLFYSMEFLDGTFLSETLGDGPIPVRDALAMAVQVARALKLIHREDVVHRNVSPSSILRLRGGVVKLLGFGSAKTNDPQSPTVTGLGEMVGDVTYSSPEQVQDPRHVDHRADLYSLGAVLFHSIAGEPPFVGQNPIESFRLILMSEPPRLSDVSPNAPAPVEDLVARLLEKRPERRYQSAEEVERALEDALLAACNTDSKREQGETGGIAGAFSGAELLEIVQFLELHKKSGVLTVQVGSLTGDLRFREGVIVGAEAGLLDGAPAAIELLQSSEGRFRFRATPAAEQRTDGSVRIMPSALALEVLRCRDESVRSG